LAVALVEAEASAVGGGRRGEVGEVETRGDGADEGVDNGGRQADAGSVAGGGALDVQGRGRPTLPAADPAPAATHHRRELVSAGRETARFRPVPELVEAP